MKEAVRAAVMAKEKEVNEAAAMEAMGNVHMHAACMHACMRKKITHNDLRMHVV